MEDTPKRRLGRPPNIEVNDNTARLEVRLNPILRRRVRLAAAGADLAMGEWVRRAIEHELERGDSAT